MSLMFVVYLIGILEKVSFIFGLIFWISVAICFGTCFGYIVSVANEDYSCNYVNNDKEKGLRPEILNFRKTIFKLGKYGLIIGSICLIVKTFLPSERTAYMMLGTYIAQEVVQNEMVQKTASNVANGIGEMSSETMVTLNKVNQVVNKKLDEYLVDEEKVEKK